MCTIISRVRIPQHLPDALIQIQFLCRKVKASRLRFPGIRLLFKRQRWVSNTCHCLVSFCLCCWYQRFSGHGNSPSSTQSFRPHQGNGSPLSLTRPVCGQTLRSIGLLPIRPATFRRTTFGCTRMYPGLDAPFTMARSTMKHEQATSTPSASQFAKLARTHTLIPVFRTVTADLETPVSAFLRIATKRLKLFCSKPSRAASTSAATPSSASTPTRR